MSDSMLKRVEKSAPGNLPGWYDYGTARSSSGNRPMTSTAPYGDLTQEQLAGIVPELLLTGQLIDRSGMAHLIGAFGRDVMGQVAIEEWMAASPVYTTACAPPWASTATVWRTCSNASSSTSAHHRSSWTSGTRSKISITGRSCSITVGHCWMWNRWATSTSPPCATPSRTPPSMPLPSPPTGAPASGRFTGRRGHRRPASALRVDRHHRTRS